MERAPMTSKYPWRIAHRGASSQAPENTLVAFRLAVEQGAQFIETDLQATCDGHLVVLHDRALDRTTNGIGAVEESTLAEIRALDAGSWFAPRFAGERIPLLEEALAFARESGVGLYLEVKFAASRPLLGQLAVAIAKSAVAERCTVLSFEDAVLASLHSIAPDVATGLLLEEWDDRVFTHAARIGARQLAPRADLITPERVRSAAAAGLPLVAWTVNDVDEMRALAASGVRGIMSDYPGRLRAAFSADAGRE
jgi:glycerophosphoryl diester phosphodiesterase